MPDQRKFIDTLNTKSDYENFSEEVEILSVTKTGNMALYTVKNKNNVTFQNVAGLTGLEKRGYMGYVNGDRGRPIMISGLSDSSVDKEDIGDGGLGGIPQVDISATKSWDIQLTAYSVVGDDTATAEYYIVI